MCAADITGLRVFEKQKVNFQPVASNISTECQSMKVQVGDKGYDEWTINCKATENDRSKTFYYSQNYNYNEVFAFELKSDNLHVHHYSLKIGVIKERPVYSAPENDNVDTTKDNKDVEAATNNETATVTTKNATDVTTNETSATTGNDNAMTANKATSTSEDTVAAINSETSATTGNDGIITPTNKATALTDDAEDATKNGTSVIIESDNAITATTKNEQKKK
jgi:hypothetical protein